MHHRHCPHDLLHGELDNFERCLSGVADGEPDSVHDARVTTRLIRELLAVLTGPSTRKHAEVREAMKATGRALGRVRELDVMEEHLRRTSAAVPVFSVLASATLSSLAQRQRKQRRKMIEQLDDVEIEGVVRQARRIADESCRRFAIRSVPWASALWANIGRHTARVKEDLTRSAGVYFADRAHAARISIKKLRYAIEVAQGTGQWRPPHLLKDLRRIQGALGDAHDAQILADHLPSLIDTGTPGSERLVEMAAVVEAEIDRHYKQYLACRERLATICAVCERRAHRRPWWSRVAA
jgi:CHAD domain-containing protein